MSPYDLPGFVGGLAGALLLVVGTAIAVPATIRIALAVRRPGERRVARGFVAAGGVVALAGIVLFWGAQSTQQGRAFDRAAPFVSVAAVLVGAFVAWRVARRARPPAGAGQPPPSASEPRG